jgi:hypothetical protein
MRFCHRPLVLSICCCLAQLGWIGGVYELASRHLA